MMPSIRLSTALLVILFALVTYFFWPALGSQLFFGYSDNAVHGLPLANLHHRILTGQESALWSPLIYGGHPLFAESQGAFANPINIVLSYLLPPITVSTLLHWLGMCVGASGMFALGRVIGLSPWASAFAALTTVFSPLWLNVNNNMTVIAAIGWMPWALFAFELWLKRQNIPTALLFAAMTSMLVLTGYPHLLYACALYMFLSIVPSLLVPLRRLNLLTHWRPMLSSGALAIVITCGLCAVQVLPLLELIPESHRSDGVKMSFFAWPEVFYRGFFFAVDASNKEPLPIISYIASLLVCMLAAGALLWRPTMRLAGIFCATYVLGNLGLGYASGLFSFIYKHNLLPGIQQFRIMHPFFLPALIGLGLLGGAALDGISERVQQYREGVNSWQKTLITLVPGFGATFLIIGYAYSLYEKWISPLYLATAFIALAIIAIAFVSKQARWLTPAVFTLLMIEIVALKLDRPHFISTQWLQEPARIQTIPHSARRDYKFLNIAKTGLFVPKKSPDGGPPLKRALAAVTPATNLLWDVPSIGGAFALQLSRQALCHPHLRREAAGEIPQTPGVRLIDLLGIRYITAGSPLQTEGLRLMQHDAANALYYYSNDMAETRFQIYDKVQAVANQDEAFEALIQLKQRTLIVEGDAAMLKNLMGTSELTTIQTPQQTPSMTFTVTKAASEHYVFEVDATRGGWLFIADNMYPGWIATLDGKPTPLFAAQLMGKAVWVPTGKHRVEVRFESGSFRLGLAITAVTLGVVLYLLIVITRRRFATKV